MKQKKFAIGISVILLFVGVTGISASALESHRAPVLVPADSGKPLDTSYSPAGGFILEAPVWEQANADGFGDPDAEEVSALAVFNNRLYAGTTNPADGARIYRSEDGMIWTPVTLPGFGNPHDIAPPAILDLTVFKGRIYASTGLGDGPGQIWRAVDGVNWAPMVIHGFGNPDTVDVTAFAEYGGYLYVGATNLVSGAQIWRSFSGDSNTWTQVAPTGLQTALTRITGMAVFDSALYAAVESDWAAQIWRSTGGAWTAVGSNGFGDSQTTSTGGMAAFAGYLYAGAGNKQEGAQLWRTSDGTSWDQVIDPGFGDPNNQKVEAVFVYQSLLHASVKNAVTGLELWRSADGLAWDQVNADGFGDSDNTGSNWGNAVAEFQGDLYVGTSNLVDGGELWRLHEGQPQPSPSPSPSPQPGSTVYFYLPVALRGP